MIGSMWFDTKKEILEYLGKNGNSVRSLERLIAKGLVIEEDGRYASRNDIIKSNLRKAKEMIMELKEENDELKKKDVGNLAEKLKEAEANVEYYKDLYEKELEDKRETIRNMYRYVTDVLGIKAKWEDFKNYALGYEGQ